ncbi:unnamed protein product [Musa acuminata subsp. malaccensis]|uniref:(wild Malaysian banana) hypothetical protein n=1 Tax=Musa acuminata subsp. malaccensis TaxID=214687 RepID=A0A804KBK5_MUSAM|nr:unnamed protein product [Musa acuminata subsp. malaccensis]
MWFPWFGGDRCYLIAVPSAVTAAYLLNQQGRHRCKALRPTPAKQGTLLGLRILLYIVAKCLQGCRGSFTSDDGDGRDEIEMQARNALALQQYYRQQLRRPAAAATSSSLPRDEWQSKLVIAAGCDHVSFIAQPCPLRTNDVVA